VEEGGVTADAWAVMAARLPLAFAQVREDPLLDLEVVRRLPAAARVMMIASGGETAVCLARRSLGRLVLVDMNAAQLALTRCRLHLAANVDPVAALKLLGHLPMDGEARARQWDEILQRLGIAWDDLAPRARVAEFGMDHCGRYEAAFSELRRLLLPLRVEVDEFLQSTDGLVAGRLIAPGTALGDALDGAFASALRLENLVELFGEGATRNPRRPFHEHFAAQLRDVVWRLPPVVNPWVWQLLAGRFPAGSLPDWLAIRDPLRAVPEFFCGTIIAALAAAETAAFDFIHLSNVLDWLSPEEASATLDATHRALKPGGFVLIRQLNSTLDIPSLHQELRWHRDEGRELQQRDRSFFYPEIHLASKR